MVDESGGRPPREKRQQRGRRGRSPSNTRRYRLLHTTLFMLGAVLLTAAIVITVISLVNAML